MNTTRNRYVLQVGVGIVHRLGNVSLDEWRSYATMFTDVVDP